MASLPFDPTRLQSLAVVGDRPVQQRPLGQRLKKLAQKGLLSALLLLQLGQVAMAHGPSAPILPHADQPVATQVAETPAAAVEFFNPIAQARADLVQPGGIDGIGIVQSWHRADIELSTIYRLTELLVLTQSPVFSSNPAALATARTLSERTAGIFSLSSQAQASAFLDQHAPDKLVEAGLLSKDKVAVSVAIDAADDMEETLALWANYTQLSEFDLQADFIIEDAGLASATAKLSQAVSETGLNSLSVPLPMWTSPTKLTQLADKLVQSNHDLAQVTGWSGPVLGLDGQVDLTIGMPYDVGSMGPGLSKGTFAIQSELDALGHEWSHALEYSIRDNPAANALLDNLAQQLDQDMPTWRTRVSDRAIDSHDHAHHLSSKAYLESRSERIGYAFSGHLNARLGGGSPLYMDYARVSWRPPTVEEAKASDKTWKDVFAAISPYLKSSQTATSKLLKINDTVFEIPALASLGDPVPQASPRPRSRISTDAFVAPAPAQTDTLVPRL